MTHQRKRLVLLLVLAFLLAAAGLVLLFFREGGETSPFPSAETQSAPAASSAPQPPVLDEFVPTPAPDDGLPADKLVITPERQTYQSGDLTLVIPKLSVDASVVSGTDDLNLGACLYDYAQLPGEGNRNVSIVAHRDYIGNGQVLKGLFYDVDTLGPGDYLYLSDGVSIYRYRYLDTKIVEADDWTPILRQGFSCLTLTSCHPVGVASQRIIVRAGLESVFPHEETFRYLSGVTEA